MSQVSTVMLVVGIPVACLAAWQSARVARMLRAGSGEADPIGRSYRRCAFRLHTIGVIGASYPLGAVAVDRGALVLKLGGKRWSLDAAGCVIQRSTRLGFERVRISGTARGLVYTRTEEPSLYAELLNSGWVSAA